MQKLLTFFSKNISIHVCAVFNGQSFNDTLTNDIVSFEQLVPDHLHGEDVPGAGRFRLRLVYCPSWFVCSSSWCNYCPFYISRKDVFAWRFILNESTLF